MSHNSLEHDMLQPLEFMTAANRARLDVIGAQCYTRTYFWDVYYPGLRFSDNIFAFCDIVYCRVHRER